MKQRLNSKLITALLFALAVALLLVGTIGGIRAAPLVESPFYTASVGVQDIGITLLENGAAVAQSAVGQTPERGSLLAQMLPEGESVRLGNAYPEQLAVQNSGKIACFVRVSLYCYWQDETGAKLRSLSPEFIRMKLCTDDGWVVDEAASTEERTVLYYTRPLAAGETTPPCCESLTIDAAVRASVGEDGMSYDGAQFRVEAEADAVQTHNGEAAIRSAWGREVTLSGGVLTLR